MFVFQYRKTVALAEYWDYKAINQSIEMNIVAIAICYEKMFCVYIYVTT